MKWLVAAFLFPLLVLAPLIGLFVQPWAPFWFGQQQTAPINVPIGGGVVNVPGIGVPVPPIVSGAHVSDAQRYQFIEAAGAPPSVAIVMTAISIAEDGSGDPAIVSPLNKNHTVDIGTWQINSAHIGQCGIPSMQWLFDPMNNANAAMCILGPHLNYCAWSTYEVSCGRGYTGAYAAFLPCARAISEGGICRR